MASRAMPSRATTSRATTSRDELRRLKHAILDAELGLRGGGGGKGRDLPARRFYNEARRRLLRGGMTKEEQDALMARMRKEAAERYARFAAQEGGEEEEEAGPAGKGREQGGGPAKRRRPNPTSVECPICYDDVLPELPVGERDPDPVLVGSPATGMRPAEPHSRAPITLHMASRGAGQGQIAHRACQACVTRHFDTNYEGSARVCPICRDYVFTQADYDRLGRDYLPAVSDAESSDDDDVSDAESSDDDDEDHHHDDAPIPLGEGAAPIHHAAARGDREAVRRLLEQEGADVDGVEPSRGRTALFLAAQNGHDGVVKDLIGWPWEEYEEPERADIFLADHSGATPLYVAAFYGHADVVSILLEYARGMLYFISDELDSHALRTTAIRRDLEDSELYDDPRLHEEGYTPLHIAAERGHVRVVEMLLEDIVEEATHAEEVTLTDGSDATPLWLAAREGHDRIVDMLLQHGETEYEGGVDMVGIDKANEGGFTPLGIAAWKGHVAVVDRLLAAGANTNIDAGPGAPLHLAATEGNLAVVERLLQDDRVDIDVARASAIYASYGATPLWIAAKSGHADVVRALVEKGADRTKAAGDGTTPLDIAANDRTRGAMMV